MRGLDKFSIAFIESHIVVHCSVCNTKTDAFPCSEDLVFQCEKCNRHFKLGFSARPLTKEEIDKYVGMELPKIGRTSFNELY